MSQAQGEAAAAAVPYVEQEQIYCFDHPWILHYHVFNPYTQDTLLSQQIGIGTPGRRTLQESSFISEDFILHEYGDDSLFYLYMVQNEIDPRYADLKAEWLDVEKKKADELAALKKKIEKREKRVGKRGYTAPTARTLEREAQKLEALKPAQITDTRPLYKGNVVVYDSEMKPYMPIANRKLPVGLREGTGAIYVYSYGKRTVNRFRDMYVEPTVENDYASPQRMSLADYPSHIHPERLLHPFKGRPNIKATHLGCDIIDLQNEDYIDAHIFTLKYAPYAKGLGLFTGTSVESSDGDYKLFTARQRITRFYGRRHKDDGTSNNYTQHAKHYISRDDFTDHGLFTPEGDEYRRLAHFLNHDDKNPSCMMITNADGYIDVVVNPKYRLNTGQTLEQAGVGLPPDTELTFDYGDDYNWGNVLPVGKDEESDMGSETEPEDDGSVTKPEDMDGEDYFEGEDYYDDDDDGGVHDYPLDSDGGGEGDMEVDQPASGRPRFNANAHAAMYEIMDGDRGIARVVELLDNGAVLLHLRVSMHPALFWKHGTKRRPNHRFENLVKILSHPNGPFSVNIGENMFHDTMRGDAVDEKNSQWYRLFNACKEGRVSFFWCDFENGSPISKPVWKLMVRTNGEEIRISYPTPGVKRRVPWYCYGDEDKDSPLTSEYTQSQAVVNRWILNDLKRKTMMHFKATKHNRDYVDSHRGTISSQFEVSDEMLESLIDEFDNM